MSNVLNLEVPRMQRRFFLKSSAGAIGLGLLGTLPGGSATANRTTPKNKLVAEETIHTDVLVVGAGSSGIPAAVAAARQGANVVLLEEDFLPGGAPVDMYVAMLCGGPRLGIYKEMAEKLNARHDPSGKPVEDFNAGIKNNWNFWYLPSSYIQVLWEMISAEKNIRYIGGARAVNTLVQEQGNRNKVIGAVISHADGREQEIRSKLTIDATGTGVIAEMAGCKCRYGREAKSEFDEPLGPEKADSRVQHCTWMYVSQRFKDGAVLPYDKLTQNGFRKGCVEHHVDHWVGAKFHGVWDNYKERNTGIYLHWGATVECKDTRDSVAVAEAQREAFEIIEQDMAIMYEHGYMMHLAPKLGIRECRRVEGEHIITVNDLKSGKMPEDVVAVSDYGIDAWGENVKREDIACPRSGIPYRALIPRNTEGLLVVGKSISGTHFAASSYRVQPIVASIGQAAGTAASMVVRNKTRVRDIDIKNLREDLRQQGTLPDGI